MIKKVFFRSFGETKHIEKHEEALKNGRELLSVIEEGLSEAIK